MGQGGFQSCPTGKGSDPQGHNPKALLMISVVEIESHWRKQVQGLRHRALLPLDSARSPSSLVPFLTLDRDRDVAPHL